MKSLFITFILFLACSVSAQNTGYFGKKNIVELNTTLSIPATYFLMEDPADFNFIEAGFRLDIGRTISRRVGFHLETGMNYFKVDPRADWDYYNDDLDYSGYGMVKVRQTSIMPKIEWNSSGGLLPIGLSHQFGYGINFFTLVDKRYTSSIKRKYSVEDPETGFTKEVEERIKDSKSLYDYENNSSVNGHTFMYKLNMRIPITKSFLFNLGFRYTFNYSRPNFGLVFEERYGNVDEYFFSGLKFQQMIRAKTIKTIFALETGVSFTF